MKLNIWILLLCLLFASCNDFLEESSQDEIRPSSVDDLEELLLGEGYTELFVDYVNDQTYYFTDDVVCNGYYKYVNRSLFWLEYYRWKFMWDRSMFDEMGGGNDENFWEMPYRKIKGCNVVLEYLDKVNGNATRREDLRGEAYVLRAFYYLTLVNYFGMPYNEGDPEKNLGVPLKLTMGVTSELQKRNSVAEVYRSIEHDLLEGNRLMDENKVKKSYERLNDLGAKALLSRTYLYMQHWDKVIDYSTRVLTVKPDLLSLVSWGDVDQIWDNGILVPAGAFGVYGNSTTDEIIWARQYDMISGPGSYEMGRHPYAISPELMELYETSEDSGDRKDLRARLYFGNAIDYLTGWDEYAQAVSKGGPNLQSGIRTAEMYLNRAEAYIRKFMESGQDEFRVKALDDINELRRNRYDTRNVAYEKVNIQDAEALFKFYKEERRRELCGEGNHRWFDLRRWGMPELTHVYFVNPGEEQKYVLKAKSSGYLLPIPAKALEYNPNLEQNF